MIRLRTLKEHVTALVAILTAVGGATLGGLAWLDGRYVSAEVAEGLKLQLRGVQRQVDEVRLDGARRHRAALRAEQFGIVNMLSRERREPTSIEAQRLRQLDEEIAEATRAIERLERPIGGPP